MTQKKFMREDDLNKHIFQNRNDAAQNLIDYFFF